MVIPEGVGRPLFVEGILAVYDPPSKGAALDIYVGFGFAAGTPQRLYAREVAYLVELLSNWLEINGMTRSRTSVCGSCGYRQDVGYAA